MAAAAAKEPEDFSVINQNNSSGENPHLALVGAEFSEIAVASGDVTSRDNNQ